MIRQCGAQIRRRFPAAIAADPKSARKEASTEIWRAIWTAPRGRPRKPEITTIHNLYLAVGRRYTDAVYRAGISDYDQLVEAAKHSRGARAELELAKLKLQRQIRARNKAQRRAASKKISRSAAPQ